MDDLDAIASIPSISTILEVACRTSGMRFAAVARVTQDRWVCCASKDDLQFGLKPGDELRVETTICEEIRKSGEAVVIDEVGRDAVFCNHPTPALYGFQSYISMPIVRAHTGFWGTLCAIDPRPNALNTPQVIGTFALFAQLIAHELDMVDQLQAAEAANAALHDRFKRGLGHDMKNTLQAMVAGTRLLAKTPLNDRAQMIVAEMENTARKLSQQVNAAMNPERQDQAAPED